MRSLVLHEATTTITTQTVRDSLTDAWDTAEHLMRDDAATQGITLGEPFARIRTPLAW